VPVRYIVIVVDGIMRLTAVVAVNIIIIHLHPRKRDDLRSQFTRFADVLSETSFAAVFLFSFFFMDFSWNSQW